MHIVNSGIPLSLCTRAEGSGGGVMSQPTGTSGRKPMCGLAVDLWICGFVCGFVLSGYRLSCTGRLIGSGCQ
jgi:hypothetical protein